MASINLYHTGERIRVSGARSSGADRSPQSVYNVVELRHLKMEFIALK
jgi:hypothetical protein